MTEASANLIDSLHETNYRLRFWLDRQGSSANGAAAQRAVSPEEMAMLLSELMQAGGCLRSLPEDRDAALEHELAEYRGQVKRLRELMPFIHAALLRERAHLEQERSRLASAAQWAERSRQTL